MFTKPLFLLTFTTTLLFILINAQAAKDVVIKSIKVSDNIYMLQGQGGNIGVFTGDDGTFIIDDQFAPLTPKILEAIKSIGGDSPRFTLNTHYHRDHTGGNENFGNSGTLIVSHHNVRERLKNGSFIQAFSMKSDPAIKVALPVLTFSTDMHFHINSDSVKAVHVPTAHTDGDSYIHFKNANVVHAGDIFFNGFYPFIDAAGGGSVRGMIQAAEEILAITDSNSKIIPGHGPLSNKTELKHYRDMLETVYSRLLKLKNTGVSVEDAILQEPLKDLEQEWGDGMFTGEKWISVIYPAVY